MERYRDMEKWKGTDIERQDEKKRTVWRLEVNVVTH